MATSKMPSSNLLSWRGFFALVFLLLTSAMPLSAQSPGELDLSFETGSTVNNPVRTVAPGGDGKVYIGGDFTTVRGGLRNGLARLNSDGTVDSSFDPGVGVLGGVRSIVIQADGKVLIAGSFTSYNGTARNNIARLYADGSIDTGFNPGIGASSSINSVAVQVDGKVLIAGFFTSYNGTARNYIARLHADGSLDTSFNPGTGASSAILSVAAQSDGKVIIGGNFTSYNGTARNRIARVNANGSLDTSFDPGTGVNRTGGGSVNSIALQADGKVFIGGPFTSYNGTARNNIARLNANGSIDTSFNPGTGASSSVHSVALQTDGKVLIGGEFGSYNGTSRNKIARLNVNGSLDTSFNPGSGATSLIHSVAAQVGGKVLIGGEFGRYNGTDRNRIAVLNADGTLDTSFNPGTGANSGVGAIAVQPDGKVLISGEFTSYNGTARNFIARLNTDGSLDTSFDPGIGAQWSPVRAIAVQADGKVLIGGEFTTYNGTACNRIARLNADGSLDTSFNLGTGADWTVFAISLAADGKIIVGGYFNTYNGTARNSIARLNANGSLDTSFNPGTGANSAVSSVSIQADGKVLIVGEFTSYNGVARNHIARLNTNGSLDTSFNPGTGASSSPTCVVVQADGKVLIGGGFTFYNGTARAGIARLNTDGSLDTSFNPGTGVMRGALRGNVNSFVLQADGKILICGNFTSFNGMTRNAIARLNTDGSLDAGFDPGAGTNFINFVVLQPDGRPIMGGFSGYNQIAQNYLGRLLNDPASQSLVATSQSRVQWLRDGSTPEVELVSFEHSPNGVAWTALGSGRRINGGWELTGLNLPASGQLRARGRTNTGGLYNGSSSLIEQVASYPIANLPTVTVSAPSDITFNSASGAGEVTSDGGATVTERGLVYATTQDPSVETATKVIAGSGIGSFTANLSSLAPSTTYYVRAYATNSAGTGYSSSVSFTTTVASANAKLTQLAWGAPLSPWFEGDTVFYESFTPIGFDESTLWVLTPAAEDPNATITINGQPASEPFLLSNLSNTLSIVVTAQDGVTTRTYTLVVRRPTSYLVPGTNITLNYTVNGSSASIVGCNFDATGALVIPPQLGGYDVTAIHPQAFQNIAGLTSVTIPDGVVSIGDRSFEGATGLTSITLPDSVVSIGELAFSGCSGLTHVDMGAGLATIGEDAFFACENLTSFTVAAANPNFASSGGALLNKSLTTLIEFPEGYAGAFVVPAGVSTIRENAFFNCDGLTAVTLPTSLVTIELFAFYQCTGLTSLSIPSGVTTIGPGAFFGCSGLTQVTIGSGVTSIGAAAFGSCVSLTSATFLGNAPTLENFAFTGNAAGFTIYYQAAASGFTTPTWNGYPAFPLSSEQTITFPQIPDQVMSASPLALTASASSGLPVTIEMVSGPATLMTEVVEGVVVAYSLTLTGSGTVLLRASQAGDSTFSPAPIVEITFNVTGVPSSNANLADLLLGEGSLSPAFAVETLAYSSVVESASSSLLVTPLAADSTATVTVNGGPAGTPVPLSVGNNTVTILVTAQDGITIKTYTLLVTRQTTYDAWASSPNLSDPLDDADGDGVSNLMEYALGSNPQSGTSLNLPEVGTTSLPGEPTYLVYSYRRPKSAGGISYVVEFSSTPNMTSATSAGEYNTVDHGDGTEIVTVRDLASGAPRFARLKIVKQ